MLAAVDAMLVTNPLVNAVIGCAITVHRELGPGLLESAYQRCLCWELSAHGIAHESEVPIPLMFRGMSLDCGYRIDILLDSWLVVEIKSVKAVAPIHMAQVLTYMRLCNAKQGLIFNFNSVRLKDGIRSVLPKRRGAIDERVAAAQDTPVELDDVPGATRDRSWRLKT